MGEVYRARDTRLTREVALKRLSAPSLRDDLARRRVLHEARASAALSHPGIAAIYDVLETPDGLTIVMEYVPGTTLSARLRGGPLSVDEALGIGEQIADALAHAHDQGVIHRDLKPSNVMVTPAGRAKILDFGIAKHAALAADPDAARDDLETRTGRVIGSPGYMAPEQIAGQPSDRRTDVHAAGLLLYEMLAGTRPYATPDVLGGALEMFSKAVPRLEERMPHVPAAVSAVVARAMAQRPGDRYPDAAALAAAIRAARDSLSSAETVDALATEVRREPRPSWRRYRAAPIVISALLLTVAAIALVWKTVRSAPVLAHSSVIGVLPIRNVSGDAANDPLVAGLSDAIARRLASSNAIRVLPPDETREALGAPAAKKKPADVAKSLGAAFVVDGTMQRHGETIEVDLYLVGADGKPSQAGRYTGEADRIFDLHRRVAEGLAAAVNQRSGLGGDVQLEPAPPTQNQDAFADYSQARVFLDRPDVPGGLDHAIDLLQRAIGRDPHFALAYAALGEACWAQYRETKNAEWTVKAQGANLEALRIDPQQPEVRMSLAVMYEGTGRPDEAAKELRQVMQLQPRNDSAHYVLSRILASRGTWDEAAAEARTAINLRPAYWRNYAQLGDTLYRAGRLDEAAAAYERLIELQPDSTRGYQRLGIAQQALGRLDEALANYVRAEAIRPTPATYLNMGTVYYWRGDFTKAAETYQRAIQLSPNHPKAYGNLGDAMASLGRRAEALANYRRATEEAAKLLTVNPQDTDILATLALYQAKLGDRAAADATIHKAMEINPRDGDVLFVQAQVDALAGRRDAACAAIADARTRGKNAVEIRYADELTGLKGCAAYDGLASGR